MKRALKPAEAAAMIPDGATVLIGGFMGVGSPHRLIDAMVEAGPRNLTLIANLLKPFYRVQVASSGEKALQLLANAQPTALPDLILLDIMMPGLDGYQVCERLKSDVKTQEIPVVRC